MSYEESFAKLAPTIEKIMQHHAQKSYQISRWIKKELENRSDAHDWDLNYYLRSTAIDIRVLHDNDYVECGSHTDDPEGRMFHVITREAFDIEFRPDQLADIVRKLNKIHDDDGSDTHIFDNVGLANFFPWEMEVETSWYSTNKGETMLKAKLEFDIYHQTDACE